MHSRIQAVLAALLIAVPPLAAQSPASPTAGPAASTGISASPERIRLASGIDLEVLQVGPHDGEPVLFLHGFPDSWLSFTTLLPHLPANVRAILPSQRGFGESAKPVCCYDMATLAADAAALLDALGIARATVVGHSMGSFVAQRLAVDHPHRVAALVLIGSGYSPRSTAVVEFGEVVASLGDSVPDALIRDFQRSAVAEPLPEAFFERTVAESEKVPARVWKAVIGSMLADSTMGDLGTIRVPTLLVSGDRDPFWPTAAQRDLERAIPGARLLQYAGIGHSPNWEQPARVATDLLAHLSRVATVRRESVREHAHPAGASHDSSTDGVSLMSGLGDWHLGVTTTSREAQRYFDQGLRLAYAFNHDEAVRSFAKAVALDSTCAMCHWGIAYALGPNINLPMSAEAEARALQAIGRAMQWAPGASDRERLVIHATARRYGTPTGAMRSARDSAYANAMRIVARQHAEVADIQVLLADALLNLRPWNQWTRDGRPQPGTDEVVAVLERAMTLAPEHPGACHFYIHTVEASPTPERALRCAELLPRLMPAAGHLVHMPAHVYLRLGRYEDAARANIAAVAADQGYLGWQPTAAGIYPLFYAPHNLHFLWAAYLLSGQQERAETVARQLTERVLVRDAEATPSLEAFLVTETLTAARFGDWDTALNRQAPPEALRYARAMWHYARGLALGARGAHADARAELDSVRVWARRIPDDVIIILNPAQALLRVAATVLEGRLAAWRGEYEAAVPLLRAAVIEEDALTYDEPPAWYHSVRQVLGDVLLAAGRPAEAEAVFREDLAWQRETGWALSGLARALTAQGRTAEAEAVARRLAEAWRHADGATDRGR